MGLRDVEPLDDMNMPGRWELWGPINRERVSWE